MDLEPLERLRRQNECRASYPFDSIILSRNMAKGADSLRMLHIRSLAIVEVLLAVKPRV